MSAILGAVAVGATPIVAVDLAEDQLDLALSLGATDALRWTGGPEETAERIQSASGGGVDFAIEATGRTEAGRAALLSTRPRGAAVLIGIPQGRSHARRAGRPDGPRTERRVLGSMYGSARPERDFPALLDLYLRGRLPIDRLITARLPLGRCRAWPSTRSARPAGRVSCSTSTGLSA